MTFYLETTFNMALKVRNSKILIWQKLYTWEKAESPITFKIIMQMLSFTNGHILWLFGDSENMVKLCSPEGKKVTSDG